MSAYQKLAEFNSALQHRIWDIKGRQEEITAEIGELKTTLDEAFINGTHETVVKKIELLKAEKDLLQRQLQVLENPPKTGQLKKLIDDVWNETTDLITNELRHQWDDKIGELEKIKEIFLSIVAELGTIKRKADSVSARTSELTMSLPGPQRAIPHLTTGIVTRHDRHSGPIFIDPKEIEKIYKGV